MTDLPTSIICVECGGQGDLSSFLPPDEPIEDGHPLTYVCRDCNHRHDLVWESEDDD